MRGPLFDDWYIRVALSPPEFEGAGPTLTVCWNEPERDQRRRYRFSYAAQHQDGCVASVCAELLTGYYVSRSSAVRRSLARMERAGLILSA